MNTATLVVLIAVIVLVAIAITGAYRGLHTKKHCGNDCGHCTQICSIRKDGKLPDEREGGAEIKRL